MKKSKNILILATAFTSLLSLSSCKKYNVSYDIVDGLVKQNPNYNVKIVGGQKYTTIAKYDSNGNISDDDFKVLAFTDTHLDHYKEKGDVTFNMIIRNIVNEKPDLVVFNGDNVTSSFNAKRANQFAETLDELGVYWTCALGNHEHDNAFSISRAKMLKIFSEYKYSLINTKQQKLSNNKIVWGNGNNAINILNANGKIRQTIFTLDGGQDMSKSDIKKYKAETESYDSEYDYLKDSQINWYKETVQEIAKINGSVAKSTIFDHIPLQELTDAYVKITGEKSVTKLNTPENNYHNLVNGEDILYYGRRREGICCQGHNSGLFKVIKELGSTQAMFCGHDHINDFVLKYQGIVMGYTQCSGYSSYNVNTKHIQKDLIKGYSLYTYHKDSTMEFENIKNSDKWPELQEEILKLYGEFTPEN